MQIERERWWDLLDGCQRKKKKGRVSVEDNVKIERLFDVQKISSLYREKQARKKGKLRKIGSGAKKGLLGMTKLYS